MLVPVFNKMKGNITYDFMQYNTCNEIKFTPKKSASTKGISLLKHVKYHEENKMFIALCP